MQTQGFQKNVMVEAKIFHEFCGQDISNYYKYRASEASEERFTIFDCLKHFSDQDNTGKVGLIVKFYKPFRQ